MNIIMQNHVARELVVVPRERDEMNNMYKKTLTTTANKTISPKVLKHNNIKARGDLIFIIISGGKRKA